MKKLIWLLIFVSPSAFSENWSDADVKREAVYLALHFIDYKQTLAIPDRCTYKKHTDCYEFNPILGKYPHKDRVDLYFASGALLHIIIVDALPVEYRKAFQYLTIGAESSIVLRNHFIGIGVRF